MATQAVPTAHKPAATVPAMRATMPAAISARHDDHLRRRSIMLERAPRTEGTRTRVAPQEQNLTLILDLHGRIRSCSRGAAKLFAIDAGTVVDSSVRALLPELPVRDGTPGYNLAFVTFGFGAGEWRPCRGLDGAGQHFEVEVSIEPMTLDGRHGLVLALRQPSPVVSAQWELRRLIASAAGNTEAVLITNTDGLIEYVNPAFEAMTGFAAAEVVGQTPRILKSGALSPEFYARMWSKLLAGEEFNDHFLNRRKGGETFYAEESIRPFVDRFGTIVHYVATLKDVTAQIRAYERLDYLANHDPLTELPNRNLFVDRLHQEVARATRAHQCFALLFIDVDKFKAVNDRFGHAVGDELLRAVGEQLKHCVRAEDTVARLGGDEFVMILVDMASPDGLASIIDKVRLVGKRIALDGTAAFVSLSVGVATFPDDGNDAQQLLRAADRAMYEAKATGCGGPGHAHQSDDPMGKRACWRD